jgi:aminoacrylate hydrolase
MSPAADADVPMRADGLAIRCFGPAAAPAVLFSAGLGGSGCYWTPQVAALAERYRVVLYDHRGTGLSDRFAPGPHYAVADLARDMLLVLDGLGIDAAHVVGHAAGAVAGLELARMAPARVASLVLVNGWAASGPHFRRCFAIRRAIHEAGGADAYLRAQPLFLFPADWIDAHLDRLDAERGAHLDTFQDRATLYARMAALERFDAREWLSAVACPTLIMVAQDDMLVPPRNAADLVAGLVNARTISFPWGGHAVNVTVPNAFNNALCGFLETGTPPSTEA